MSASDFQVEGAACCGGDGAGATQTDIGAAVRERYGRVAERASAGEANACGAADKLYASAELASVNAAARDASAGCGNPAGLADIKPGETVLDLGSGGGIDCFLAAKAVGADGMVIGVDATPEMVALARANAAKLDAQNVVFKLGKIEALPEHDDSVDLVISNCVISLSEHKDLVFQEIFRVLKSGGRFIIADMVSVGEQPSETVASPSEWAACVGGADERERYLERMRAAGFARIEVLDERAVTECELPGGAGARQIKSVTVKGFKP